MRLWFSLFLLMSFTVDAKAFAVKDDRNIDIAFKQAPQRVVSLLPSLTESVCALGQCHRLVGVDRYSNFPAQVKKLPQLGGGLDPHIEAIVALRPDVVLMGPSSKGHARLTELGLTVLLLEPKNKAQVLRSLQVLGALFQLPDQVVSNLWQTIERGTQAAAASVPQWQRGMRVYFEVGAPYAAGQASFVGELLNAIGLVNIVPRHMGPFPALSPEFVVKANPAIIMMGDSGDLGETQAALESVFKALQARPGWASIEALKRRHVCVFTGADSDVLVRPGPRMAQAAQLMANCLTQA